MKKKMLASVLAHDHRTVHNSRSTASGAKADEDPCEVVMVIPTLGAEPSGLLDVENALNEVVEPELGETRPVSDLLFRPHISAEPNDYLRR